MIKSIIVASIILMLLAVPNCYAQLKYSGQVVDSNNSPISLATITTIDVESRKPLQYTTSDAQGRFEIKTVILPVTLRVAHLAYETVEVTLETYDPILIVLPVRTNQLEEIKIERQSFDIIERNDTISYNLTKLLNGSERSLKDILDKLPGVKVDENGKIRFNGKLIDNLLIDGDAFFNENHQIATENITEKMVANISVYKNYQDFASIAGFESSGATALNVELNDNFRNITKGNFEAHAGVSSRYKQHNSIYNFSSKNKFSLVTDVNNLNYSVISITDYIDLKRNIGKKILEDPNSSGLILEEDLPSFLFSEDNVQSKDIANYTLNFSKKITQKKRLEFTSIFNKIKQNEHRYSEQFFNEFSTPVITIEDNIVGGSVFWSNILKYENKLSPTAYLNLTTYLLLSKDTQKQDLINGVEDFYSNFNDNSAVSNTQFGFSSRYKNKLSSKVLHETILFNSYNINKSNLVLNSNIPFSQFNTFEREIYQQTNYNSFNFGIKSSLTIKMGKSSILGRLTSSTQNDIINNSNTLDESYIFKNNFSQSTNSLLISYNSASDKKFKYNVGTNFFLAEQTIPDRFNRSISALLPVLTLSYTANKNFRGVLGYNVTNTPPDIMNFLGGTIIQNYRTELIPNQLIGDKMLSTNILFNVSYNSVKNNIFSVLNVVSSEANTTLGKTYNNTQVLTQAQYQYLNVNKSSYLLYSIEKKFRGNSYGINFESLNSVTEFQTFINSIGTTTETAQNKFTLGVKSYYKLKYFNFSTGAEYVTSASRSDFTDVENRLQRFSPYMRIYGVFNDDLHWTINSKYIRYESTMINHTEIFDLGFNLEYDFNTYKIHIKAHNILNVRNDNTRNTISYNPLAVTETIFNSLPGYITAGISFSL